MVAALGGVLLAAAGCGADGAAQAGPTSAPPAAAPAPARAQLAGAAAAAKDRGLLAFYTLKSGDRADRTVTVVRAPDRSWRVDIPGGALGGTADVSVAQNKDGLYQCALPSAASGVPATCVRVAAAGGRIKSWADPRVQHPFTDWLEVFTDSRAALSVSTTKALPGSEGTCYSVESTSASLSAPVDAGIYCYATDGTLTAARLSFGTLTLSAPPGAPPARADLPGPVVSGEPMSMAAPPPPPTDPGLPSATATN
jgi:hypothetical protein